MSKNKGSTPIWQIIGINMDTISIRNLQAEINAISWKPITRVRLDWIWIILYDSSKKWPISKKIGYPTLSSFYYYRLYNKVCFEVMTLVILATIGQNWHNRSPWNGGHSRPPKIALESENLPGWKLKTWSNPTNNSVIRYLFQHACVYKTKKTSRTSLL